VFIAAVLTRAKLWNEPRCPSANAWIKNVVYIHNGILFNYKEEWNYVICRKMDKAGDRHVN
jgi:hypothetical protein